MLIVGLALLQLTKLIFPSRFLKEFHLTSDSFMEWSFLHTIPSMYNYSNRIWVSSSPYNPDTVSELLALELEHEGAQINHYPVRVFTFRLDRETVYADKVQTVYIRSIFAGETRIAVYICKQVNGVAVVELREEHVSN
jgi:hypothetical protein